MDKVAEVVLHEENRRFSMDKNRPASGRVMMRSRADTIMITLEAGMLRPLDQRKYTYRMMLLGLKDGHSLHIIPGDFQAGKNGMVKAEWQLQAADADGRGHGIEDFFVFMLAAVSLDNPNEPYHPVMKGDWDRKWAEASDNTVRIETYNDYYMTYVKEMAARLIARREGFRAVKLFEEEWITDSWRVAENAESFPIASVDAVECIASGGHFVFAFDDNFLLLGVPGRGEKERRPDGGASGFTLWQPVRGSDIHGYWLTAVRRETGEIVGI